MISPEERLQSISEESQESYQSSSNRTNKDNNTLSSQIAAENIDRMFSVSPAIFVVEQNLSHHVNPQLENSDLPELVKPESFHTQNQSNANAQESQDKTQNFNKVLGEKLANRKRKA